MVVEVVDATDGATDDEEEEAAVVAAGLIAVVDADDDVGQVDEEDEVVLVGEAEEELLLNRICAVCRSVGGVADEWPTSADRSPCPGAMPGGKLLGRPAPPPAAENGKQEES